MGEAFWSQYLDPNKSSASTQLSHWLTRVLKRIGFSVRKNTVSQKIPDDWQDQSRAFSKECLKFFREKDVSVIVCADQTFVNFLLAKEKFFVDDFNNKESKGLTNIILPCLSKVGQNCFSDNNNTFETWLGSLTKNALYKSLLDAHTAVKL